MGAVSGTTSTKRCKISRKRKGSIRAFSAARTNWSLSKSKSMQQKRARVASYLLNVLSDLPIASMEHAGIVEEMAALPAGLAKQTGKEVEAVGHLQDQVDKLNERARSLEKQLNEASAVQRASGLSAPLDSTELAAQRENAAELSRVELALQAARTDHRACRRELAAALSALGGGDVNDLALNLAAHSQLFEFLRASETHRSRASAIEERLRLLAKVGRSEDG